MSKKSYATKKVACIIGVLSLAGGVNSVGAEVFGADYRPYVSVSGGWQTRDRAAESAVVWTDWKNGYDFNLSAGLKLYKLFRVDFEWSQLRNDAKTLSGDENGGFPASGSATLNAYTLNAYVDYAIPNTPIEIFGGLGYGTFRSELSDLTNNVISPFGFIFTGTSTYAPVWQARLGLTYNVNDNFQIFAAYRYFDGDKIKFTFNLPNGIEFHAGPQESVIQSGEIGLRYLF
jgi:opacity protein-like surface antigen